MTVLGVAPEMERNGMTSDYARALGARLRAIRTQQGLSLHGVEKKSKGRWKAVVVGSYERGDRAVTVQKLAELADFYGVPVGELLPEGRTASAAARNALTCLHHGVTSPHLGVRAGGGDQRTSRDIGCKM